MASDLVSWRDEKLSAAVLGTGLLAFYICSYMSAIAFFSYSIALLLLVRLVYYSVHRYLVHAKLAVASPPPVIPSEWLTEAEMMGYLQAITTTVNSFVRLVFSLLYMESTELGLKCIVAFGITGYIARQLGTSLLFLCRACTIPLSLARARTLAAAATHYAAHSQQKHTHTRSLSLYWHAVVFVGAFTLPKAYELKQPEVDAALTKARGTLSECQRAIMAKALSASGAAQDREKKKL